MVVKLGQITNADLYLNGEEVKGRVSELTFDALALTEVEHSTLGMVGVIQLPGRPVQAIGGTIKFDWLDEEIERSVINPTKRNTLQLHSYVDVFDDTGLNPEKSYTLVTHVGYHLKSHGILGGSIGEATGVEHAITVPYISQKVYGGSTPIFELDVFNSIYNVNGEPVWPTAS